MDGEHGTMEGTGDGQRFLVVSRVEESTAMPLTVVSNWTGLLKK